MVKKQSILCQWHFIIEKILTYITHFRNERYAYMNGKRLSFPNTV